MIAQGILMPGVARRDLLLAAAAGCYDGPSGGSKRSTGCSQKYHTMPEEATSTAGLQQLPTACCGRHPSRRRPPPGPLPIVIPLIAFWAAGTSTVSSCAPGLILRNAGNCYADATNAAEGREKKRSQAAGATGCGARKGRDEGFKALRK